MTTRLTIAGSTAKSTAFVHERVDGPDGTFLFMDGNGKITAGNGTLAAPRPNAFSLVQIMDCPSSTDTCRKSCYVHNLASAQPDLHALYVHNSGEIRRILENPSWANDWAMRLAAWITANASEGFRWHVSGDLISLEYAQWIADVCRESPNVRHWIYTRSFQFLEPLVAVSTLRGGNLALNLSCDKDNYDAAVAASVMIGGADGRYPRLCYLTVAGEVPPGLGDDDVVFLDYQLRPRQFATLAESPFWQGLELRHRGMVCPVDAHAKSETRRCGLGANQCGRCLS